MNNIYFTVQLAKWAEHAVDLLKDLKNAKVSEKRKNLLKKREKLLKNARSY